jgi:hypothetical protein
MSIFVQVRSEAGEPVDRETGFGYQQIVSWSHRQRFPLLCFIDPYGLTIFNRAQVLGLSDELRAIADLVARDGVLATARELGVAERSQHEEIVGWDLERDYVPLIEKLLEACKLTLERQHRYLWFIGD